MEAPGCIGDAVYDIGIQTLGMSTVLRLHTLVRRDLFRNVDHVVTSITLQSSSSAMPECSAAATQISTLLPAVQ